MIDNPPSILTDAKEFVEAYYRTQISDRYVFHNFQHVCDVVAAARTIGASFRLEADEMEVLELAAWFHDTGYGQGKQGHEERSQQHARYFLRQRDYSEDRLREVLRLIEATRMDYEPQDLMQEIIRDADFSHLGSEHYWDRCSRIRQELLMTQQAFMPEEEWVEFELEFMNKHRYHTTVAQMLYDETKKKNVKQLKKYSRRVRNEDEELKKKKKKKKGDTELKQLNLGRGVETMYRTTYRTHVNLSSIADNKANIMLSINAIIISIVVSNLVPKFNDFPELVIPTLILLAVCLIALVFAILSTRPKITEGRFTREDIEQKRSNLLFFGNYYRMDMDDFHWGMMEMIKDSDFLYSSMTRDLYFLGAVLAKKYRYLRICYSVFMYGLILSVLAFALFYLLPIDTATGLDG